MYYKVHAGSNWLEKCPSVTYYLIESIKMTVQELLKIKIIDKVFKTICSLLLNHLKLIV